MAEFVDDEGDPSRSSPTELVAEVSDLGIADFTVAHLQSENIRATIEPTKFLAGIPSAYRILVPSERVHRARAILREADLTEQELVYLATGELAGHLGRESLARTLEERTPGDSRPILVTLYSLVFGAIFVGGVALLVGSAISQALGKPFFESPDGSTPLTEFADHWILGSISLASTGLFSVGLWRGCSAVRHLILGSWTAAFVYACIISLQRVSFAALLDHLALFLLLTALLWWYFFRKTSSVRFFSARGRGSAA